MKAFVFIETAIGKLREVSEQVKNLPKNGVQTISCDAVTGIFDVVVILESDDLDKISRAITDGIQQIEWVQRTTTCLEFKG